MKVMKTCLHNYS